MYKYILCTSTFYVQVHFMYKYILCKSTFHVKVHFMYKYILCISTFYVKEHFTVCISIGICINDKVTVLDVNLVGSKNDGFERLWVLTRINSVKTAVDVAYFPNDGIDKSLTINYFMNFWKTVRFSIQKGMKFVSWSLFG
jgi:hypothetical protein